MVSISVLETSGMGQNPSVGAASLYDVLADPKTSQQLIKSHGIPDRPLHILSVVAAMTTSPTQYLSALSLASSPSPSSHRAPPPPQSSSKPTPSYRSLSKSHRRLESTIAALQSQLSEEKRSAAWWKNRVCELDARCRSIDVDLARVTREKHALDWTVAKLQMRETLVPRMIEAATQTDEVEGGKTMAGGQEGESQKDLVIKTLIQMVWDKQGESVLLSTGAPAGCECDAARALRNLFPRQPSADLAAAGPYEGAPEEETEEEREGDDLLKRILRRRGKRPGRPRATGALERGDDGSVPLAETPPHPHPHPHPQASSEARREKKEALKMRVWEARERVDRLRKQNGVLEELIREGSEADSNRAADEYGNRFGYG
ncbi:unnamed protein product [Tuber aestivum]|uniref:Uncharacterized protein n=1 Tax=Tuber aestivum TaxID=59557 RepID=A0A292PIC6_9PEZI|nr:unnamed protein product [Tuber aestivum]